MESTSTTTCWGQSTGQHERGVQRALMFWQKRYESLPRNSVRDALDDLMGATHGRGLAGGRDYPRRVAACAFVLCVCFARLAPTHADGAASPRGRVDARDYYEKSLDRLLRVTNHAPANVMHTTHVRFPAQVRTQASAGTTRIT